jgi:hypothetical protein
MRRGSGLVLGLALSLLMPSACQNCPHGCPATEAGATLVVTTSPAKAVSGVQAILTGPVVGTMSCQPNFSAILCSWPNGVPFTPGTYSLQVSAPGYPTTTIQVEVGISSPGCGCTVGSISPSTISLGSADAATD